MVFIQKNQDQAKLITNLIMSVDRECQLTCYKRESMSSDIDYEIDVRGHRTNKITCQATCYQKKIENLCQAT